MSNLIWKPNNKVEFPRQNDKNSASVKSKALWKIKYCLQWLYQMIYEHYFVTFVPFKKYFFRGFNFTLTRRSRSMAQIDCHPLRQIFCLDDYLPLASGVTSITCDKWISFIQCKMNFSNLITHTWPDESQFRITDLLAFICIWLPTPGPCLSPDCWSEK